MTQPLNPYDFVPFESRPERMKLPDLGRSVALSGTIGFSIYTLTPLFIHHDPGKSNNYETYEFARFGKQRVVPATSLKGMLRSVHEVVTNSTMSIATLQVAPGDKRGDLLRHIPTAYRGQSNTTTASPSEVLFGFVGQQDETVGRAGRVFIDDIPIAPNSLMELELPPPQGGPKPTHRAFYFDVETMDEPALGRKFYYHQQNYTEVLREYIRRAGQIHNAPLPIRVEAVKPAVTLPGGRLHFINLEQDELANLVYALILEWNEANKEGLAHKLGYGKPLGLGSIRFVDLHVEVEPAVGSIDASVGRYFSYQPQLTDITVSMLDERPNVVYRWKARPDGDASYEAFAAIAAWPQMNNSFYPTFRHIKDNPHEPLRVYQGRAPGETTPRRQTVDAPSLPPPPPLPDESRTPIDFRQRGTLGGVRNRRLFISGQDGAYLVLPESSTKDVLDELQRAYQDDRALMVRFIADRRKIDGKYQKVALDIDIVAEDIL